MPDDLSDRSAFERHLAVNLYGTLDVTQAFLPALTRSQGAVVNVVPVGAVAAVPVLPAYSVSKAASLSPTQSLRALLAGVARAIIDGIENGEEEIFPDPMAAMLAEGWRAGVSKELERQNATLVQPQPLAACNITPELQNCGLFNATRVRMTFVA